MNKPPEDYRHAPVRCAACRAQMCPVQRGKATIDRCPSCGAVWIDWFDGDAVELLRGLSDSTLSPSRPAAELADCPRCQGALLTESFRDDGPDVARCNQCFGVFVPGGSAALIAAMAVSPATNDAQQTSGLSALGRWLESVLWKGD